MTTPRPLDPPRLRKRVAEAFTAERIGEAEAFLIASDQDADDDSPNFLWERGRSRRPGRGRPRRCAI